MDSGKGECGGGKSSYMEFVHLEWHFLAFLLHAWCGMVGCSRDVRVCVCVRDRFESAFSRASLYWR